MEMTTTTEPPPAMTALMLDGSVIGRHAVAQALAGQAVPVTADADRDMAAANYLAYVMFGVQLANGLHPKSSADFIKAAGRGEDLARQFLLAGTVEVCCDYCGQLMAAGMVAAAAAQMTAIHGDQAAAQWQALSSAMAPP